MASTIKIKRSAVAGNIPSAANLQLGELAVNTYDGKLYLKKNVSGTESVVEIGATSSSATSWVKKTNNYSAVNGDKLIADTSAGTFTITLPATPNLGDSIIIADGAAWGAINLTIARNASTIEGLAENLILDITGVQVEIVYDGATWEVYAIATSANTNIGYKNIPAVGTKTSSYTLATADVGKYVQVGTGGSITIPDAIFSEGDVVSIFNNTASPITITCSITTAYISGSNTDRLSITLGVRGTATILFISSTACVLSGNLS